jgi:hypothetical protein
MRTAVATPFVVRLSNHEWDCDAVSFAARDYTITSYAVETFCSLSTVFRTVGRCIMRSCQAV